MLNCHDVTRLLSASQERPLTLREAMPLKMHLMMCAACRNFDKQLGTLRQVARAYAQGKNEKTTRDPER